MDYKEKYEQGLECIQEILSGAGDTIRTSILQKRLQPFFPELKESEDERIRKWCISHFNACINVIKDNDEYKEYLSNKVIAWLEKQGDKKPTENVQELDADKVKEHVPIMLEYMQNYVENIRKLIKGE